ncbi:uncharacterized protein LOC100901350 [Galendromus occidentalis]|uniref:Uncharacterized protein LOC100901350 n=1 Tax=Galendromus occidentalis TaxID=34638 RepID=A0AAJ6VXG3_9ACAR|nr:uncharacterized protein LOC100901350 [Galendromus occidentalis]
MRATDPLNVQKTDVDYAQMSFPNNKPIKFREVAPMQLRDRVSLKRLRDTERACLAEMMTLFTCLAKKDFETSGCPKEIAALNTCYKDIRDESMAKKQRALQQAPVSSIRELTSHQANALLKKFPLRHLMKKVR